MRQSRVALVLSGGASLGAIQVGMLRALVDEGVRPDLIVGTSVGALNGAFVASHGLTRTSVDDLAELWLGLRRGRIFPLEPVTGLLGFLGARRNLVPAVGLRRLIARNLDHELLDDLPVALHVLACDVLSGAEVRISTGPLVEALMASTAIPGVFPPVDHGGRLLMDGGVVDNTPISHALELGADRIYVLPTGGPCDLADPPRGSLGMLVHAVSLMVGHRFIDEAAVLATHADLVVLPPPCPITVQPTDFGHAQELIERAEAGAREFLAAQPVRAGSFASASRMSSTES